MFLCCCFKKNRISLHRLYSRSFEKLKDRICVQAGMASPYVWNLQTALFKIAIFVVVHIQTCTLIKFTAKQFYNSKQFQIETFLICFDMQIYILKPYSYFMKDYHLFFSIHNVIILHLLSQTMLVSDINTTKLFYE